MDMKDTDTSMTYLYIAAAQTLVSQCLNVIMEVRVPPADSRQYDWHDSGTGVLRCNELSVLVAFAGTRGR